MCLVGRMVSCHLWLDHPSVSGTHAVLQWEKSHWTVRDLGSRNGTSLSGFRLDPAVRRLLVPGVRLEFGTAEPWTLISTEAPGPATSGENELPRGIVARSEDSVPTCRLRFTVAMDGRHIEVEIGEHGDYRPLKLSASATYLLASLEQAARQDATGDLPAEERGWLSMQSLSRVSGVSGDIILNWSREVIEALAASEVEGALDLLQIRDRGRWLRLAAGCAARVDRRRLRTSLPTF